MSTYVLESGDILTKYNPYHDERGRFSDAGSAFSVTFRYDKIMGGTIPKGLQDNLARHGVRQVMFGETDGAGNYANLPSHEGAVMMLQGHSDALDSYEAIGIIPRGTMLQPGQNLGRSLDEKQFGTDVWLVNDADASYAGEAHRYALYTKYNERGTSPMPAIDAYRENRVMNTERGIDVTVFSQELVATHELAHTLNFGMDSRTQDAVMDQFRLAHVGRNAHSDVFDLLESGLDNDAIGDIFAISPREISDVEASFDRFGDSFGFFPSTYGMSNSAEWFAESVTRIMANPLAPGLNDWALGHMEEWMDLYQEKARRRFRGKLMLVSPLSHRVPELTNPEDLIRDHFSGPEFERIIEGLRAQYGITDDRPGTSKSSTYVLDPERGLVKHLQGQHPQARHAGGRAKKKGLPADARDLWNDDARQKNARLTEAVVGPARVAAGFGPSDSGYAAVNYSDARRSAKNDAAEAVRDRVVEDRRFQKIQEENTGLPFDPDSYPDDSALKKAVYGNASELHETWSLTSYDNDAAAHQIQDVAEETFLIDNAWKRSTHDERWGLEGETTVTDEYMSIQLQAQYDATQQWFSDQGFGPNDEITMFRGVGGSVKEDLGFGGNLGAGTAQMQPLSSWSTNPAIATDFGEYMMVSNIKVRDIQSAPFTGFGCLPEFEFVVLGGIKEVVAWSQWSQSSSDVSSYESEFLSSDASNDGTNRLREYLRQVQIDRDSS